MGKRSVHITSELVPYHDVSLGMRFMLRVRIYSAVDSAILEATGLLEVCLPVEGTPSSLPLSTR